MRKVVIILICLSLAACSNYTLLRKPGWLKSPFSKSTAKPTRAATNAANPAERTWYCYPEAEQKGWDCQDSPVTGQTQAASVVAPSAAPVRPVLVASVAAPTPPPPVPELIPKPDPEPETLTEPDVAVAADAAGAESEVTALNRNVHFIMNHPDDYLAVQLIALESLAEIEAYAVKQRIDDPIYVRIRTRDKIWMVLLLGIYPDRDSADQAILEWSETHAVADKPWIRKLDALVAAMQGALVDE